MTSSIIILIATLLLLAYVFDITSNKTKIPTVILLLLTGFLVKLITFQYSISVPNLSPILPVLGTIGLILIVLEGALELEINKSKVPLIIKSSIAAALPILAISFELAYFISVNYSIPLKLALANAIPLGIISSAIAIPSAKHLVPSLKEFVIYESSLSDILGVIFFNFIYLNDHIEFSTFGFFIGELILMLIISFIATLLLAGFLNRIKHHVKIVPMLVIVILIYAISKKFHLPALIFILIFGLFMGNLDEFKKYKFVKQFHPVNFQRDVHKFKEITGELAFAIRSVFFILFGFLISIEDVLNTNTILLSLAITASIFLIRYGILKILNIPANPAIYLAPRGLITILLFLSIPLNQQIPQINQSLITQVIILTALVMMTGLMRYKGNVQAESHA